MPPKLGLYSIADTPEELLSEGYGLVNTEFDKDPAFGDLIYNTEYSPAPYTGAVPFQNVFRIKEGQYYNDLDNPSFGGISGYRDIGGGITELDLSDLNNMGVANEEDDLRDYLTAQVFSKFSSSEEPTDITELDLSRFQGVSDLGRDDEDVEQVEYLTEPTGIKKLLQYLPFGEKSLLRRGFEGISNLIPRRDPRAMAMQNFYGSRFGLTPTGSVASGIMAGYNPVSGFGQNKNIGLARAMQKRIERIQETLKKKNSAQLENRLENLRNLQRQEIQDRSDRGESLSDIGKSTFSGKGMAFEKRNTGTGRGPR